MSAGVLQVPVPGLARRWWEGVLRVPLLAKLLGANLTIVAALAIAHYWAPGASPSAELGAALAVSFAITALLVWLALRPVVDLEETAERVSDGDFTARVPGSELADPAITRLSATLNRLLDRVQADRARIEYLAGRSVRARDIEREAVARELRESLAQMVTAIALQISAIKSENTDLAMARKLEATRAMIDELSEQVRDVAETLYPGTIEEFGLGNALIALGRQTFRRSRVHVEVDAAPLEGLLSTAAARALYRVAEETLRNIVQHANATDAKVYVEVEGGSVFLTVEDNGRGIDMRAMHSGLGLFSARSVLALTGGDLQISSAPGHGLRVTARVPTEAHRMLA